MELKPCPFCGSSATWEYHWDDEASDVGRVQCESIECGAKIFDHRNDAIEAWNRRVTDQPAQPTYCEHGILAVDHREACWGCRAADQPAVKPTRECGDGCPGCNYCWSDSTDVERASDKPSGEDR